MKKHRRYLAIGIVAMSLLLSGCGNPIYELTEDEEALIVNYAAYILAKHNVYQQDGISNVYIGDIESEEDSKDTSTQKPDDTQLPSEGNSEGNTEKPADNAVSIADAVELPVGLSISYVNSSIIDHVKEGDGYSVDAGEGFTFYVMTFKIENTTEQDIAIDNASIHPVFKLSCGKVNTKSSVSFLSADLSTYQNVVKAGESVETFLLFKVNAADAEKIINPTLQITIDDVTKNVEL